MTWRVELYSSPRGTGPVSEFMSRLPPPLRAKVARDIDLLSEFGIQLGAPYLKRLTGGRPALWELRTRRGKSQVRIIFSVIGERQLILLHGFLKKTGRVPRREIETAEGRLKRVLKGTK